MKHPYVGLWVAADGTIRHELQEDGRYRYAFAPGSPTFHGRYEICGNHINYWDDSGFVSGGSFTAGDELRNGDVVLVRSPRRQPSPALAVAVGLAIGAIGLVALADPAMAVRRHVRTTSQINYHPQVVGPALASQLEALDQRRTGLFGGRSWVLSIGEVNQSKGTSYSSFEHWVAAEPDDPVVLRLGPLLQGGILSPGGRTGERGR